MGRTNEKTISISYKLACDSTPTSYLLYLQGHLRKEEGLRKRTVVNQLMTMYVLGAIVGNLYAIGRYYFYKCHIESWIGLKHVSLILTE